mmetsp:Transcript_35406/g.56874  ORF Transcript_35406/g.56874 Transcript_35406/m.56874 type:complete len:210 (+) Transcript_35406:111-740(+)
MDINLLIIITEVNGIVFFFFLLLFLFLLTARRSCNNLESIRVCKVILEWLCNFELIRSLNRESNNFSHSVGHEVWERSNGRISKTEGNARCLNETASKHFHDVIVGQIKNCSRIAASTLKYIVDFNPKEEWLHVELSKQTSCGGTYLFTFGTHLNPSDDFNSSSINLGCDVESLEECSLTRIQTSRTRFNVDVTRCNLSSFSWSRITVL